MKVLFTNSPLNFTHGHTFTQPDWQTLVLPTLAGITGNEHDILLVDNNDSIIWNKNLIKIIESFKPDVIGFSVIAARDIFSTIRQIQNVKKNAPHILIIAGGQGATFYKKELLDSGTDIVIRGEGEITLKEVLDHINKDSLSFSKYGLSFNDIAGISLKQNGIVVDTIERKRIKKLDDSPMPRWDLMPLRKSRWFSGRFTGSIETSRGCPHACSFCAITSFWEKSFRRKSNERIIDEMKVLIKQGRSHFYFADDNFGMGNEKHILLFEEILRQGLDVKFFAQMRTDTIAKNPKMVQLAAKAGLYGALIGFDTYDSNTFHHISKQGSQDLNILCSETMRNNNIMIFGTHIYGLPTQKKPIDFLNTFIQGRKNSDLFRMPHFSILPGTDDYKRLISKEITDISIKNKPDDNRLLIRSKREKKRFKKGYAAFNLFHLLSPDEILKTIFSKNKNVRIVKKYGYIATLRHYAYKYMRKLGLTNI
jgi:anaerobic magnesium-protoporphyrin IX monomethyl ester cyclase